MKITDRIEIDPRVCNGKPVIEGEKTGTAPHFLCEKKGRSPSFFLEDRQ